MGGRLNINRAALPGTASTLPPLFINLGAMARKRRHIIVGGSVEDDAIAAIAPKVARVEPKPEPEPEPEPAAGFLSRHHCC